MIGRAAFLPSCLLCLFVFDKKNAASQDVVDIEKGAPQGQGDADPDAVSPRRCLVRASTDVRRGLDNAGKTTIVKKIMNEDVNQVSPTLGFIIKTIDYEG